MHGKWARELSVFCWVCLVGTVKDLDMTRALALVVGPRSLHC